MTIFFTMVLGNLVSDSFTMVHEVLVSIVLIDFMGNISFLHTHLLCECIAKLFCYTITMEIYPQKTYYQRKMRKRKNVADIKTNCQGCESF